MTRKQKHWAVVSITLLLLLISGIGWALASREDPQLALVRKLQSQAFAANVDPEQRRELFEKMRAESEKLTAEQRRSLREDAFGNRRQEMQQRVSKYFELGSDERVAYLDEQINEMEQRRKEWEKRSKQRDANSAALGRGPNGPGGDRAEGPGRGRGNATAEDRNDRRRGFLSMTSAEDRAKFMAYMGDLNDRRKARGLEPMDRGGFGGGRGR